MVQSDSKQAGVPLECKCGKEWTYKGSNKVYATCPDCKTNVRIKPLERR